MPNPTTPGVSVEEITKLPYSITLVDTAMPVFIGYTELIPEGYNINDNNNEKLTISSLLEYEDKFGYAKKESIQLKDTKDKGVTLVEPDVQFLMYYSLQLYFANGGGSCYIISVGTYNSAPAGPQLSSLKNGLDKMETLKAIKDPILIVFPDAVSLTQVDFYNLYNETIGKIETKNRFAILDTYYGNSTSSSENLNTIGHFRAKVNSTNHAAAYFPHLKTILNYTFDENETAIIHTGLQQAGQDSATFYADEIAALDELKSLASDEISSGSANAFVLADLLGQAISIAEEINETADVKTALTDAIDEAKIVLDAIHDGTIDNFIIPDDLDESAPIFSGEFDDLINAILAVKDEKGNANGITLKNLESSNSLLYNEIKEAIRSLKVVLPPSSAMAGVYGRVDSTRGVWKAPANVSLKYVIDPTEKVSEQEQSVLNIHDTGKSINAIRTFTGKGTLVWGARTLDGKDKKEDDTDNEWKYVHARRYYDMIEESISQALGKFINEPNISYTWLRAKTMIENFLNQQWMDGALAGNTTKEAYEVKVYGSKDPITENITDTMIVEIKIALVRPAEFIVLNFSHKLQQS
ncbi:phage tail sheath protein FI [Chryseobacterium ginsenosidimutans]|uniref:phage tail sheath family protein n=1 Tax=Chryseobacterium ginsenosidimutans TaxID=687846 RepID=UPI00216A1F2E|nr:phage tail sheath C-terminal domain-containing protein [Chryseobacterium ginsenosidimutans]MCS3870511.1 phage tail sheath protein FI [Chryseobacterium ginsenosidimutans]